MSTAELATPPAETKPDNVLIEFGIDLKKLELAVAADLQLKINGIDDTAGYKLVDTRRKGYVKQRTGIDRVRKELNADDQARIKKRNSVADDIQAIIGKGEDHLDAEVTRIDKERERLETEAADKIYSARKAQLEHVGIDLDRMVVDSMTDEQIAKRIDDQVELNRLREAEEKRKAEADAVQKRLAAELAEKNRLESERLAAERAEFDRQRAEQEAERLRLKKIEDDRLAAERAEWHRQRDEENEKLAAERAERDQQAAALQREKDELASERKRLADAETERLRAALEAEQAKQREAEQAERDRLAVIELEKQKAAAAEQARVETEQRLASESEQKKANELAAENQRKRIESERPYREQLLWLAKVIESADVPIGPKTDAVKSVLTKAADEIRAIAKAK